MTDCARDPEQLQDDGWDWDGLCVNGCRFWGKKDQGRLCSACIEDKRSSGDKGDSKRSQLHGQFQPSSAIKREAGRVLQPHLPDPLRALVCSYVTSRAAVLAGGSGPIGMSPSNKFDYLPDVEMFDESRGEWRRLRTLLVPCLCQGAHVRACSQRTWSTSAAGRARPGSASG